MSRSPRALQAVGTGYLTGLIPPGSDWSWMWWATRTGIVWYSVVPAWQSARIGLGAR